VGPQALVDVAPVLLGLEQVGPVDRRDLGVTGDVRSLLQKLGRLLLLGPVKQRGGDGRAGLGPGLLRATAPARDGQEAVANTVRAADSAPPRARRTTLKRPPAVVRTSLLMVSPGRREPPRRPTTR
jgi:hypothetical protein